MEHAEELKRIDPALAEKVTFDICRILVGRNLSFRQAQALLDMAKERIKDAKI